ncbi:MAG: RDD family protein [Cyclobacteriaceae bacterium]
MKEKVQLKEAEEVVIIQEPAKAESIPATTTTPKKKEAANRFKMDRLQISDKLDGVILASFNRRMVAFLIDVAILLSLTVFWWLAIIVFIIMKVSTGKLGRLIRRMNISIGLQMRSIDRTLEGYEVEEKLRRQFRKHLRIYLKVLIYLPVAVAIVIGTLYVIGLFNPQEADGPNLLARWIEIINESLNPLNFIIGGFVSVLYFGVLNYYFQGQTLGKKICKIRVVKLNGKPMTFRGSVERATGYTASGALFFYGFLQYFWDPNRQTTHDKITETIVIRK